VTTPEARAVVRDGIEGRIVPARDPDVLADAIIEIIEDREKRDRIARASRERARDFTWACYGERLTSALKSFTGSK
jgi:glycosyltransferase involved in cell wall biosynthesis